MSRLEQALYWSYECAQQPVLAKPKWLIDDVGAPSYQADAYSAHHAAAKLHGRVSALPDNQRHVVSAKYGLQAESLYAVAQMLVEEFEVPEKVAKGLVLAWLGHPERPRVWMLAEQMGVSERTVKRLTRRVYDRLDSLNAHALRLLSARLALRDGTIYNTKQIN